MSDTVNTLPPCHVTANERIDDALIGVFPKTGRFVAMLCGVLRVGIAVAVLVPKNRDGPRQAPQAMRIVEKGALEEFLVDPATHGYLRSGTPVVVLFADLGDYTRLLSIIPELPVSSYEQHRRDEERNDAALERPEEAEEYEPDYDHDRDEAIVTPGEER